MEGEPGPLGVRAALGIGAAVRGSGERGVPGEASRAGAVEQLLTAPGCRRGRERLALKGEGHGFLWI